MVLRVVWGTGVSERPKKWNYTGYGLSSTNFLGNNLLTYGWSETLTQTSVLPIKEYSKDRSLFGWLGTKGRGWTSYESLLSDRTYARVEESTTRRVSGRNPVHPLLSGPCLTSEPPSVSYHFPRDPTLFYPILKKRWIRHPQILNLSSRLPFWKPPWDGTRE